jgi:ferritin-like metal-binding protein YciE
MAFIKECSAWWQSLFETISIRDSAIEILRQRYVEEKQRSDRFEGHAARMRYPQYRERFLSMAHDTSEDATAIGDKILALGAKLPDVACSDTRVENSWHSLSSALDEENRSTDRLVDQLRRIESEEPDIAQLLQQIFQRQATQRRSIQDMLMRSDPFAQSLA